jgi:hypothetical protein
MHPEVFDDSGEEFEILPEYQGEKRNCDACGKEFLWGDLIMVSQKEKYIFCPDDEESLTAGCVIKFVLTHGIPIVADPMKFIS